MDAASHEADVRSPAAVRSAVNCRVTLCSSMSVPAALVNGAAILPASAAASRMDPAVGRPNCGVTRIVRLSRFTPTASLFCAIVTIGD